MLINKSLTLQDELHQASKYIAYLGKLYEKSNNKTLETLGKYYVEISHVINKLSKIIPKSFLKVKSALVGVKIQDDCPVAEYAVDTACEYQGLVWGLALSAARVSLGTSFLVGLGFLIGCGLASYYADTSTNC